MLELDRLALVALVVIYAAGPSLLLALTSAGLAMIRTRTNSIRIQNLEMQMCALLELPASISALEAGATAERRQASEEREENREDHTEIKNLIVASEGRMIEAIRHIGK
jgi:hypothetical protein